MKVILRGGRAARTVWVALGLAAALAVSSPWLRDLRVASPDRFSTRVFRVTSGADAGPGSLREAIVAADRADARARLVIDVQRIAVATPLPPLVNPAGMVIESRTGVVVLDASGLVGGPVLDVVAPDCVILGVRIERAPDQAILIRKGGARLRGVTIADSNVGVQQLDGAAGLTIESATFERNTVGVHVAASGAPVKLHDNRFRDHRRAAIWAVASNAPRPHLPIGVDIARNQFAGDLQPLVLFNVAARVERNVFESAHGAAVYVSGSRAVIRNNRMRAGRNFGVYAEEIDHGLIVDNEVDHNCAGGLIVRNSRDTEVSFNRVYANGYGIILVHGKPVSPNRISGNLVAQHTEDGLYVIGGSPILRNNQLLQNRKAGLRLSSVAAIDQQVLIPQPLLQDNVLSGNGINDVHRDEYAAPAVETRVSEPLDCSWRLGGDAVQVAALGERR